MRLFLALILVFIWSSKGINAQNTSKSAIKSAHYKEAIILPKKDNKQLLLKELALHQSGRAVQFAVSDTLKANVFNAGSWTSDRDEKEVWTLEVESEGAFSLNLAFKKFKLTSQSQLFIYNKSKSYVLGPFTSEDNDDHGQLWTPIIKGDRVIIELHIPSSEKEELIFELSQVNHDFLGFGKSFSGSCNLDVVCSEEDGFEMVDQYRDIIRSVGAYHINGIETCTGALINNTAQDKRGFFLTADHCGLSSSNAPSVVTYWNFENSTCRQPNSTESGEEGDGNLNQFNSGTIFRASNSASDVCLIEFDDPIKEEYEPYFSGWHRDFQSTEMAICIHHPGVDEKRISFEFDQVVAGFSNYIDVFDWDLGTTEGGSSGSPLYTEDKKIIGQLRGGLAACSNDLGDNYGNFGISWDGDGTPSGSLDFWLDPLNLDLISINGFEGNFGLTIENNFQELCAMNSDSLIVDLKVDEGYVNFVNIEVSNIPSPLQLVPTESNITPGESTLVIFTNLSNISSGDYTIVLSSTDGVNTVENEFVFSVSNSPPITTDLVLPVNGFAEATNNQILVWNGDSNNTYQLQVSSDSSFGNIDFNIENIEGTNFIIEGLSNLTTYYWRVIARNVCGEGDWSEVFQFDTQVNYCFKVKSEDFFGEIPASGTSENRFNLFFKYPVIVNKLTVENVDLTHSYISDLDLELFNPETNQPLVLMSSICNDESNLFLGFEDGANENFPCPPVDGELYDPAQPLRTLIDINAQGLWQLLVRDNVNFDGGIFKSWELEVCFSESLGLALVPVGGNIIACEGEEVEIPFFYNTGGETFDNIKIENAAGTELDIAMINGSINGSGEFVISILDTSLLTEGSNELFIIVDNIITEPFNVELQKLPTVEWDLPFSNGAVIAALELIEWQGSNADTYLIEISEEVNFSTITWSSEAGGNIEMIEPESLEDGDYYLRISAMNACGTISSDLYNFSVDETVSIIESTKKPLLVSQSLTEDKVLISGNSDNAHISATVISISGQKLLTQNSNEASLLLDVSTLIPGVYLLELRSGEQRTINKIVVY